MQHMSFEMSIQVVKDNQTFQRVVVSRDEALAMFQENKFKVEIISGLPQSATISLYRYMPADLTRQHCVQGAVNNLGVVIYKSKTCKHRYVNVDVKDFSVGQSSCCISC